MSDMYIVSLNLGQPETLVYFGNEIITGGRKTPAPAAMLRFTNFDGDGQADLKNHGGPDKAVCVYSFEHYPYWEKTLGVTLAPGAFSENLTIAGLRESEVCIGDVFDIGEARVQISQPRQPCSKLAGKNNRKDLPGMIHANSFSGFYFRVLREGMVRAGDAVTLVKRHPLSVTVEFANQVVYKQRADRASLERLLEVEALSKAWRASLSKRL
jgi:MOSC domain-containing protein YiiM